MNTLQKLQQRFRAFFRKEKLDAEMDEEIRLHIEMQTQKNAAAGMSPDEARYAALRQFGWAETIKEDSREQRGVRWLETMLQGVRFGTRQLLKNPGFTGVAVLTIALCLGANLTIFAVINAVLLRALPFPEADRLVTMYNSYPKMGMDRSIPSFPNYYGRRGNIPAFSSLSAYFDSTAVVGEAGSTELADVMRVSPEFFGTLGVNPALGRAFTEEEMTYQTDGVVILTDEYWLQKFDRDANVLGKSIRMDGFPKTIVGVLPPNFHYLSSKARIFHPLSSNDEERGIANLHSHDLELVGRLKPEATLLQAQAQIDSHNAIVGKDFPYADIVATSGFHTVLKSLHADHVGEIRPIVLLLQAGVLSLLLIGGVNLVNLLLIRAGARAKEMAVRRSLGASRQHVLIQALVETGLLALTGGVVGLVVGAGGIRLLGVLGINQLPLGAQIAFDGRLACVALSVALLMGVVLGLPIAWFNLRGHLASALQSESRGGTVTHAAQRLRHGFIVAQIALAFVLLCGAGLLGLSLKKVMEVSPGFRPDHTLAGRISLPWKNYQDSKPRLAFTDRLLEKTRQLPGVVAAGVTTDVPVNGSHDYDVMAIDGYIAVPGAPEIIHQMHWVTGDYFAAMGISLRAGRFLTSDDSHRDDYSCVVDEDFARTYWPQGNAIGHHVFRGIRDKDKIPFTVVGVVAAVKQTELTDAKMGRAIYFPYSYQTANKIFLVSRTSLAPEALSLTLQKTVREIDPELPIYDLRSMEIRIADSLIARRSPALLAAIFAGVALLLAAIGTYGVLAYAVAQRRREIGVRMALGALPKQIARQFLAMGLRLLGLGSILGILGAWLAGRVMQGVLFDVPAVHPATLAGAGMAMSVVALAACWLPIRRAARVDPMVALKSE